MPLLYAGVTLEPISKAIGNRFTFEDLAEVMSNLHGEGSIHEATTKERPREVVAKECIDYTRRRGLLAEMFLIIATRTDVEEKLRFQLADLLRLGFKQYADVSLQVAAATSWLPPPPVSLPGVSRLGTLFGEVADAVERPWVIKDLDSVARRLLTYSRKFAPLFDQHGADQDLEIGQVLLHEFERGIAEAEMTLKRISRPQPDGAETRWVVALRKASEAYREAMRAREIETVRACREVLTNLLEMTALDDEIRASGRRLSFERLAVLSREVSKELGVQATVDTSVAPAFLICDFAFSYRSETYERWKDAISTLQNAVEAVPTEQHRNDDAWLATFNDKWSSIETLVRTLSLLDASGAIAKLEEDLADSVNSAFEEIMLEELETSSINLVHSLAAYVDFTTARKVQIGHEFDVELGKLLAFREFVQQLKVIVAVDQGLRSGQ
ncbi:hypothetical protein [Neorhizobium huautlense]|uniref:hypothetical protein n=1 Tax=Neorhizobium huautlense TaxID=67774 RepID=UPI000CF86DB9|nr:hypothetical protein [Neorhizobium huautlense]